MLFRGVWPRIMRAVGRRGNTPLVNRLQKISYSLYRATYSPGYDSATNGEQRCLRLVASHFSAPVVLDVGAHVGEWAHTALTRVAPQARVVSFEPTAGSFAKLRQRVAGFPSATCINAGLSDADGERQIAYSSRASQKSSVETQGAFSLNRKVGDYVLETCRFRRGDGVLAELGVASVSYLKIDTEGHDLSVLRGFAGAIAEGRIEVIQFEYNRLGIYTKMLLEDFYRFLNPPGEAARFAIGRVYPNSVRFSEFEPMEENFIDGNFLAVRLTHPELIGKLRG